MDYRIERDSMGQLRVPANKYWGAQAQRFKENFPIVVGREPMPLIRFPPAWACPPKYGHWIASHIFS